MNQLLEQQLERFSPSTRSEYERALRELLQEITLCGLWRAKFFGKAAFYGGTALRILYGLDHYIVKWCLFSFCVTVRTAAGKSRAASEGCCYFE